MVCSTKGCPGKANLTLDKDDPTKIAPGGFTVAHEHNHEPPSKLLEQLNPVLREKVHEAMEMGASNHQIVRISLSFARL
jgi:hypothetical protein